MFHLYNEGDAVKQGFNFFRLSDKGSAGVYFRWNNTLYRFRYSKYAKKFFFTKNVL